MRFDPPGPGKARRARDGKSCPSQSCVGATICPRGHLLPPSNTIVVRPMSCTLVEEPAGVHYAAMRGKAMGTLTKLGGQVVALGSVLTGKALIASGLRRAPEGWRRTLGILLRSEPTRFALSSFGVCVPPASPSPRGPDPVAVETHLADRLRAYLSSQPDAHFRLEWRDVITLRERSGHVDVVLLRFAADGNLENIEPQLASSPAAGLDKKLRDMVHQSIVTAYNWTRKFPEVYRPVWLKSYV